MSNEEPPARITLQQIYLRQVKDGSETKSLLLLMQEQIKNALADVADHESRIRKLEAETVAKNDVDRSRNWTLGICTLIVSVATVVLSLIALH